MPANLIRRLLILGAIAVIGIISIQSYWLLKTWDIKDKEFDQTVNIMLRQVAQRIAKYQESELPKTNLIQRQSSNYYAVNVNTQINLSVLEDFLHQGMQDADLHTDFEYAVYDCFSQDLVYGNYCHLGGEEHEHSTPKEGLVALDSGLEYYFVVRFPSRESYLLSNMNLTLAFAMIAIASVLFFLYSIWVIVKQRKLSELQRDFINNMTHEFKTPISSIKIAADVLRNDAMLQDNTRLQRYADIIKDQNNRLNDQVEKVLNIARLERDNFELNFSNFDVIEELKHIVDNEKIKLAEGQLRRELPEKEITIKADKLHFTNVLTNIIDNAVKYSGDNVDVLVSATLTGNQLHISVQDKGIGIAKDQQKEVFQKFYRVSTGDVHNVKGFGLGLFYVKNILAAHGWKPIISSEPGKGTTFTIEIIV